MATHTSSEAITPELLDELESLVILTAGRHHRGWIRAAIVEAGRHQLAGEIRRILDDVPHLDRIPSAVAWLDAWTHAARSRAASEASARPAPDPLAERRKALGYW